MPNLPARVDTDPASARLRRTAQAVEPARSVERQIGQRIRALRAQRNVTLDQLAVDVKLTKGQLSKIENGKVSSPVSTLTRIAVALDVEPGYFFQSQQPAPRASLVRHHERRVIVGRASKMGHTYQALAHGLTFKKDFESYLMRIDEKNVKLEQNIFKHPGHELLYMLKGAMDYRHAEEVYHLEPGDSLFFDGILEHGPVRVYDPPVEFLSIISNPHD